MTNLEILEGVEHIDEQAFASCALSSLQFANAPSSILITEEGMIIELMAVSCRA